VAKTAELMNCIRGIDYPNYSKWEVSSFSSVDPSQCWGIPLAHGYLFPFRSSPVHCREGTRRCADRQSPSTWMKKRDTSTAIRHSL